MPPLVSSAFLASFLRQLDILRQDTYLCDCKLVVARPNGPIEFAAHKLVLAASSPYFRDLFSRQTPDQQRQTVTVNLNHCSSECVEIILQFLYSGELHLRNSDPASVLKVAKACQISSLEQILSSESALFEGRREAREEGFFQRFCGHSKLIPCACVDSSSSTSSVPYIPSVSTPLRVTVPQSPDTRQDQTEYNTMFGSYTPSSTPSAPLSAPAMLNINMANAIANSMAALAANAVNRAGYYGPLLPTTHNEPASAPPFTSGGFPLFPQINNYMPPASLSSPESPIIHNPPIVKSRGVNANDAANDGQGIILPTNEKEGWCRNKKYIQKVANGFMCIVCKKIYGRYNSVSYHVTIYHRNPPIKCDEPGCQFTTREARYIHFHKYYRHGTTLPKTIDLGTRSCPFCRHVAKSPAMLEKHVARHLPDSKRISQPIKCSHCDEVLSSQKEIVMHQVKHAKTNNNQCLHCSYRGRSSNSLRQHILFKHSTDLFRSIHTCSLCEYKAPTSANLIAHKRRKHKIADDQAEGSATDEEIVGESDLEGVEGEEEVVEDPTAPPPSACTGSDHSKLEVVVSEDDDMSPQEVSSELDDSHSKLTAATTGYHSMIDYGSV